MRFAKKLTIEWALDVNDFMLPPLTVRPLIENAIRQGIHKKKGGGTLWITSKQMEQVVYITIHDNGVGFDPTKPITDGCTHLGIANTRSRLKTLCGGVALCR